jgi:hypothetical protein
MNVNFSFISESLSNFFSEEYDRLVEVTRNNDAMDIIINCHAQDFVPKVL